MDNPLAPHAAVPEPLLDTIRASLMRQGYAVVQPFCDRIDHALLGLAHRLGTPQPARRSLGFLDVLSALSRDEAPPNSLSSRYGLDAFPFHTDDAVEPAPARWLLLGELRGGAAAPTKLLDGTGLLTSLGECTVCEAREAPYFVANGSKSFLATIMSQAGPALRCDFNAMRPAGRRARDLRQHVSEAIARSEHIECTWEPGRLLVLDNHRMFHARGAILAPAEQTSRALLRVLVQEAP